jgi:hypothetical protein
VVLSARRTRESDTETDVRVPRAAPIAVSLDSVATSVSQYRDDCRSPDEWLELARANGLLSTSIQADEPFERALLKPGKLPNIEYSAPSKDVRVETLELQRAALAGLLGTLLIGAVALYAMNVRPETVRQQQVIYQLTRTNAEQRASYERQSELLATKVSKLEARLASIRFQLNPSPQPDTTVVPTASTASLGRVLQPLPDPTKDSTRVVAAKSTRQLPTETEVTKNSTATVVSPASVENESVQATQPADTPIATAPIDSASEPAVNEPNEPVVVKESVKPPDLKEAMKSAVSKETSKSEKSVERTAPLSKVCDKNDPLCGDLS